MSYRKHRCIRNRLFVILYGDYQHLILSHVNEQPMRVMQKSGFYDKVGKDNFCKNIYVAIDRAENLLKESLN